MNFPYSFPAQHQKKQPGIESEMKPMPIYYDEAYLKKGDLLKDKVAIITGGDSGIGRAVSVAYSLQGAKVVIVYLNEDSDADETKKIIEDKGGECVLIKADIRKLNECNKIIQDVIDKYNKIDILVNNAAVQYDCNDILNITDDQFDDTIKTNIYGAFYLTRAALKHMKC